MEWKMICQANSQKKTGVAIRMSEKNRLQAKEDKKRQKWISI